MSWFSLSPKIRFLRPKPPSFPARVYLLFLRGSVSRRRKTWCKSLAKRRSLSSRTSTATTSSCRTSKPSSRRVLSTSPSKLTRRAIRLPVSRRATKSTGRCSARKSSSSRRRKCRCLPTSASSNARKTRLTRCTTRQPYARRPSNSGSRSSGRTAIKCGTATVGEFIIMKFTPSSLEVIEKAEVRVLKVARFSIPRLRGFQRSERAFSQPLLEPPRIDI